MVRTPCRDKNGLKKGTWTPEEDRRLKAYVTKFGCSNWRQLPKYAGLPRCGKSCRLRWLNYLRPDIKRGNYTKEEEDTILRLHASLGNRWSAIAAQLPGRTDNEIKNHWHTNLKKRMQTDSVSNKKPKRKLRETRDQKQQNNMNAHCIVDSSLTPQAVECSSISLEPSTPSTSGEEFAFCEPFEEPIGNLWTDPFVCDSYYTPIEFLSPISDPFGQLLDDEMLFSYSLSDLYECFT